MDQRRPGPVEAALWSATGVRLRPNERFEAYLWRLAETASTGKGWSDLPSPAKEWVHRALSAAKKGQNIPVPDGSVPPDSGAQIWEGPLLALLREINRVQAAINGKLMQTTRKYTSQQCLDAICQSERPLTRAEVARVLGISRQSVDAPTAALIQSREVAEEPDPARKPLKLLTATAKGKANAASWRRLRENSLGELMATTDPKDLVQAATLLGRLFTTQVTRPR